MCCARYLFNFHETDGVSLGCTHACPSEDEGAADYKQRCRSLLHGGVRFLHATLYIVYLFGRKVVKGVHNPINLVLNICLGNIISCSN